jgi:filamentous hemagglutinin
LEKLENNNEGFAEGTLVHTADGLRTIESIKAGDLVLSFPEEITPPNQERNDNEFFYTKVACTHSFLNAPVHELKIYHLAQDVQDLIKAGENQLVYHCDIGWVKVKDISLFKKLVAYNFGNLLLGRNLREENLIKTYNLELEALHTFYVGQHGAWVHTFVR